MRDSSPLSRRALLGLAAAAPLAAAVPTAVATSAYAATAIGGERLGRPGLQVQSGVKVPAKLTAKAWLVADHDTGEVLAAFDAHRRLAPASTLKMLFADTVLGKFDRTQRHKVTPEEIADVPAGSSLVGVKENYTYTVEQLWLGVFLRSGNDAVHVLSHMNGGIAKTVAEMQAKAVDLQALDTQVRSPDGFDHKGQVSSAYDLTLFARHGLKNDDFRAYCGTKTADFPAGGKKTFQIQNTDRLLTGAWGLDAYDGIIGVKNGYTSHAGNTFTGAATRNGRTLLVSVLHPESGGNGVYKETAQLLDWGFAHVGKVEAVGKLVDPVSEGGAQKASGGGKAAGAKGAGGPRVASASGDTPSWGLIGGAGAAVALLAGGALALRGRRRRRAAVLGVPGAAGVPGASGVPGAPAMPGAAAVPAASATAGIPAPGGPAAGIPAPGGPVAGETPGDAGSAAGGTSGGGGSAAGRIPAPGGPVADGTPAATGAGRTGAGHTAPGHPGRPTASGDGGQGPGGNGHPGGPADGPAGGPSGR
jgi:D-alanyl-D-alanine carboxypeptidase (penicillin-binding protein 5/6)